MAQHVQPKLWQPSKVTQESLNAIKKDADARLALKSLAE